MYEISSVIPKWHTKNKIHANRTMTQVKHEIHTMTIYGNIV